MIYLLIFLIAAAVALLVTPTIRAVALKLELVDMRSKRKVHNRIITRFGGLAIYIGFVFAMATVFVLNAQAENLDFQSYIVIMMASSLILILGLFDDARGANAFIKFSVQILAAFMLIQYGFVVRFISNPFGDPILLGPWSVPVTLLWLVGITNAINLIDGLDGLAAGIVFIVCSALFCIYIATETYMPAFFAIALAGACLGFLRYNFHPARIFMGDTGSLFLGFSVAALAIITNRKANTALGLFLPAVISLAVPIADTSLAFFRRIVIKKVSPFRADNEHIHHLLLKLRLSDKTVVFAIWGVTVLLNALAIGVYFYLHG